MLRRLRLTTSGLYPVFTLAVALLAYGVARVVDLRGNSPGEPEPSTPPQESLVVSVPWIDPEQPYLDRIRWIFITETQPALKAYAQRVVQVAVLSVDALTKP